MRGYKITAKFGKDTIKFELPIGYNQETLNDAWKSARIASAKAFGFEYDKMTRPDAIEVTVQEYFED